MIDIEKELARLDAQGRGDPLTPEEIERIRAQERRLAAEMRIRHEEWGRAQGFPYWPLWAIPATMFVIALFGGVLVVAVIGRLWR